MNVACLTDRIENLRPKTIRANTVIHLAASLRYRPEQIYQTNILGTQCLLKAMGKVERIIFVSSRAVYGMFTPPRMVDEMTICNPMDAYGRSKLIGEHLIQESGIPYVVFRSTGLYGYVPERTGYNFVHNLINDVRYNGHIKVIGGQQLMDALPVWDLANLIKITCMGNLNENLVLNVAGEIQSLQNMVDIIIRILNDRSIRHQVSYQSLGFVTGVLLDTSRLQRLFPEWKPSSYIQVIQTLIENTF